MTASNVVAFGNQTGVVDKDYMFQGTSTESTTGNTITVTGGQSNYCGSCGVWHSGWHQCTSWYPQYVFPPAPQVDEVRELKAWIDGFMDGRKMTERNLQKVRDKIEEFCG